MTAYVLDFIGEPRWIRTIDPLIKSQMLYRLSYGLPKAWSLRNAGLSRGKSKRTIG